MANPLLPYMRPTMSDEDDGPIATHVAT